MRRTRLGRGAVEPRARGDEDQGGKNDFLRFQEQLLRRKKQKLFLGVSVGNGVRGGITLHKIGGGSAIKVNFIALTLHYLCRRKGVRDYYLANCHRFAGAVRSRHARGASASWARGGRTTGAGR